MVGAKVVLENNELVSGILWFVFVFHFFIRGVVMGACSLVNASYFIWTI